ncbi:ABC transporter ATP-binding protein [Aminobacter sp. MSH1]|uniref:ABC transporter ATP-binding protein n=1 Tax=Aminobacter sp. MSH1 TaxID=374606 RepID=UPI000D38CC97|nr:ABC transporter ATP-binding protein [Aminobacter sp. MSH1]
MTPLLDVEGLTQHISTSRGIARAVDGVSLTVNPGETLGLVGESGCGKSTLAKTIIGLRQQTGGTVRLEGVEVGRHTHRQRLAMASRIQMVFQDSSASLNPRLPAWRIVEEPLRVHKRGGHEERKLKALELLQRVGLQPYMADRYPHELSGGQRQRVGIARALALSPKLVICDEPVSALDVSVQAQVLNLILELQQEQKLSYLFISHDLSVIRHVSHRIAVMYLGRIVEIGKAEDVWHRRTHPYTALLLSSLANDVDPRQIAIDGEIPDPLAIPRGCRFRSRCPIAQPVCAEVDPQLESTHDQHYAACHFAGTF